MSTAAERAAEVVEQVAWDVTVRFSGTDDRMCRPKDAIAALMTDPELLVDLAIEAGARVFQPVPSSEAPPPYTDADKVAWVDAFYAHNGEWVWGWTDERIVPCRRRDADQ